MSNDEKRAELIARLIGMMIVDKQSLSLETTVLPRRVNWRAQVHINDTGKLVGKGGTHLEAFRVVVGIMGRRFDEYWRFDVMDPEDKPRALEAPRVPDNNEYVPHELVDFLYELLETMIDERPLLRLEKGMAPNEHLVTIDRLSRADYKRLATALPMPKGPMTPAAAIGTLFRACGRQRGIVLKIVVPGL